MTRISPEDEKASLTIHGPIAAMVPPAAAALSSDRRVNFDTARWVATLDDTVFLGLFPDCDMAPPPLWCDETNSSLLHRQCSLALARANVPSLPLVVPAPAEGIPCNQSSAPS